MQVQARAMYCVIPYFKPDLRSNNYGGAAISTQSTKRWIGSEFFCVHNKECKNLKRASSKWPPGNIVLLTSIIGPHQKTNSFRCWRKIIVGPTSYPSSVCGTLAHGT